ncbi:hypothetical protein PSCFBP3800_02606 [Pseudomonas syringae group genomosp. 3]|uniref:Uncharacterized protein n=1 Tax=Pseudomonas syringae group genomosp. 3 TaxID=251701 RepID=A0A2K4WD15_9PSED|nr:hypothetical protein PSYMP_27983 [Pseudomonas amygdali pv. morsprunorum str. M302280]SOS33772.1 hypothetical protein CFBP6411_02415 [Pseudomonas syringae group genomosp. 3]SPF18082.1 hypothetical protein PSCFBP3800_02606 [Pseudomonas syringae group genomosp. 3]
MSGVNFMLFLGCFLLEWSFDKDHLAEKIGI